MPTIHNSTEFIVCPACHGRGGLENGRICPTCRGEGVFGWLEGRVCYWGLPLSQAATIRSRLLEYGRVIGTILAFVIGLFFLVFGGISAFEKGNNSLPFGQLFTTYHPGHTLWWIGVVGIAFIIYRLSGMAKAAVPVMKDRLEVPAETPSFDQLRSIAADRWLHVSRSYTTRARNRVEAAVELAGARRHAEVNPLHMLHVLLGETEVATAFARLGAETKPLRAAVERGLTALPTGSVFADVAISLEFRHMLLFAYEEAWRRRGRTVEILDLLTAILRTTREAHAMLYDAKVELEDMRNVVVWQHIQRRFVRYARRFRGKAAARPKGMMNRALTAIATPFLNRFSTDLTLMAKYGLLDFCVSREDETESIFRSVEAGSMGLVLVGQPGVGRRTIIAGLAQRMILDDVPPFFRDKRLVSVSVSALVSGANAVGEAEARLQNIVAEANRSGNIILCFHDVHNLVGAGGGQNEGLDLSEVLAEYIGRRAATVIATTDPLNYRRVIEPGSLGEALQKITVPEMDDRQTIQVLEAKAGPLEATHRVFVQYNALEAVVKHARRYVTDRFFPDKAVRLFEEVVSYVRRRYGQKSFVAPEHVAEVISTKINMPVTEITQSERDKLLHLEDRIHERLIGQDEAVKMVAAALRRARTELRDLKRPIANFLFLGPTGVGKTELAKTVANVYFGSEKSMIRLDMSEYQDAASVERLIGGTDGQGAGSLTEAVRRTPYTLLLLDELEKSHPDVLNVFLQVMDDGRLTDGQGRTIDFTNVILIATSNAATPIIQQRVLEGVPIQAIRDEVTTTELKKSFAPEFINRFDGIMVFTPLSQDDLLKIAQLLLSQAAARLEEKGIFITFSPEAVRELVEKGYEPQYGARPLRRVIQNTVDNALANYLLQGKLSRRDVAVLEPGGYIRVEKAQHI